MAGGHLQPMPALGRPAGDMDAGGGVWGWVFVSGAAHVAVIALLLIMPFLPDKNPPVPVYTVDLVGGEKLGSGAGTGFPKEKPLPAPKAAPEVKGPTAAELAEAKRKAAADLRAEQAEKKKAAAAEMVERQARTKREKEEKQKLAEEAEAQRVRDKIQQLKQQRVDEAQAEAEQKRKQQVALQQQQQQLREREQQRQQQEQQRLQQELQERLKSLKDQPRGSGGAPTSTLAGNNPGAAAPGVGGTGGGIVKSAEFIRYQNIIRDRVKTSWTWPDRRADLKITVNVSIQQNGDITGVRLVGTSGDRSFDDSVVRAIRRASPLPPPPEDFRKEFLDVNLSFNINDLGS